LTSPKNKSRGSTKVVWHLKGNGPWRYRLSELDYTPEVDAAVDELLAAEKLKAA
jgi:hypothetical protein